MYVGVMEIGFLCTQRRSKYVVYLIFISSNPLFSLNCCRIKKHIMYRIINSFLITTILIFTFSCGGEAAADDSSSDNENDGGIHISIENDDGEKQTINIDLDDINLDDIDLSDAEASLEDALSKAAEAISGAINDGEKIETMNFRDIKAIIPKRLLGMDRVRFSGEKNGAMGITISQANAKFRNDEQWLKVDIVDGATSGIAKIGGMAWSTIEIDKESDDGYERTTTIDDYKVFESFSKSSGKSELKWFYKDRYIISLEGKGLDGDDLRKALRRIDYEDLD